MRFLIVFAVVCSLAFAQEHGGHEGGPGGAVERLVADEVKALIHANPSITVAECTTKCDAVFALDVPQDETVTDRDCGFECRVQIEGHPTGEPPSGEPPGGHGYR